MAFVQIGTRISKKDAEYLDKLITEGYAVSRSDAIRLIIAERADLDKKRKAITPLSPSPKRSSRRKKYTFKNLIRVTYDINGVRYENGIPTDRNISSTPIYEKPAEEEEGIDLAEIEPINVYVDAEGFPLEQDENGVPAEDLAPDLSALKPLPVPDLAEISEESEPAKLEESAGSSEELPPREEGSEEEISPPKLSEASESSTPSKKSPRDYFGFKAQHDDSMFEGWTEEEIRDYKQKFGLD